MQTAKPNLFTRHDTFFGICEAVGEDFGFNANYLRLIFAVSLLMSPAMVLAAYFGLGAIILVSRWISPARKNRKLADAAPAAPRGDNDETAMDLAKAA